MLSLVDSGELVLPETQRDFVWSKKSVMLLFDSLYRGLPIGHMLVWKTRRQVQHKRYAHQAKLKSGVHDNFYGYLLDGQQRLTAISRVRDADDEFPLLFNLWPEEAPWDPEVWNEYQPFYWWRSWAEGDSWVIRVSEVLDGKFNLMSFMKELKQGGQHQEVYEKYEDAIFRRLSALQGILEYSVGITEFGSESHEEATELFIRFNSTGRKLSKGDLVAAELALKVPGLSSADVDRALVKWAPQYRFTRPFLIQCLVAVHTRRMVLKEPRCIWDASNPTSIRTSWKTTEQALGEVIKLLTGTIRWDSSAWVPSFNALIPLIVVFSSSDHLSQRDRELARSWLLLTGVRTYFSGSVYTDLDRVLRKLKDNVSVRNLWRSTSKRLGRLKGEDFETNRISGPIMSMFVSMLRNAEAKDWKLDTPLNGAVIGHNAELQVHHFFPRALLRREGHDSSRIDTFANYTVISKDTNLHIGTEEPATYLKREKIPARHLDAQCIPLDKRLWRIDRYDDFLAARRKLLSERANTFLGLT